MSQVRNRILSVHVRLDVDPNQLVWSRSHLTLANLVLSLQKIFNEEVCAWCNLLGGMCDSFILYHYLNATYLEVDLHDFLEQLCWMLLFTSDGADLYEPEAQIQETIDGLALSIKARGQPHRVIESITCLSYHA